MSIFGYSGKPGAGKSYSVVEHAIIPALKKGRTVYHNMQLNEERLRAICGEEGELIQFSRDCTPSELIATAPAGALVVIDESLRYWPSGIKANKVAKDELEFFTMHRHRVGSDGRSTDIVLICQDFGSQCAAFIRELIQFTYYSVKLSHLGLSKKYRMEVYEGCVKGDSPPKSKLVRKTISTYRKEIFACYVSHTASEKGVAGEEIRDNRASVWKNWKVIAAAGAIVAAVFFIWLALHSISRFKDQVGGKSRVAEHSEASGTYPLTHAKNSPIPSPPQPDLSKGWRLSGEIIVNGVRRIIVDGEHTSRYLTPSQCRSDDAGNRTCTVDGQLVAEWTGPAPAAFNKWFQTAASPTSTAP